MLNCDELQFSPNDAAFVVPNQEWQDFAFDNWDSQQQLAAEAYSAILDQMIVAQLEEPCPWRIVGVTE